MSRYLREIPRTNAIRVGFPPIGGLGNYQGLGAEKAYTDVGCGIPELRAKLVGAVLEPLRAQTSKLRVTVLGQTITDPGKILIDYAEQGINKALEALTNDAAAQFMTLVRTNKDGARAWFKNSLAAPVASALKAATGSLGALGNLLGDVTNAEQLTSLTFDAVYGLAYGIATKCAGGISPEQEALNWTLETMAQQKAAFDAANGASGTLGPLSPEAIALNLNSTNTMKKLIPDKFRFPGQSSPEGIPALSRPSIELPPAMLATIFNALPKAVQELILVSPPHVQAALLNLTPPQLGGVLMQLSSWTLNWLRSVGLPDNASLMDIQKYLEAHPSTGAAVAAMKKSTTLYAVGALGLLAAYFLAR